MSGRNTDGELSGQYCESAQGSAVPGIEPQNSSTSLQEVGGVGGAGGAGRAALPPPPQAANAKLPKRVQIAFGIAIFGSAPIRRSP